MKKAIGAISYIHDRSKTSDRSLEECKSAMSHIKESKGSLSVASNMLNPRDVLSLFERMLDEVHFFWCNLSEFYDIEILCRFVL